MVKNQAIRFNMNIKGLKDSITAAREPLELETLHVSKEECHKSLSATHDELMNGRANTTIITRVALRGEPTYIPRNHNLSQQLPSLNCKRPEGQNSFYL